MTTDITPLKEITRLANLLEEVPVGITVIDLDGRIRYYNAYCARIVDRKPEHIGEDIRACHRKAESITRIDRILEDIRLGRRETVQYESVRNGKNLAVTVSAYREDGRLVGCIQSFVVLGQGTNGKSV